MLSLRQLLYGLYPRLLLSIVVSNLLVLALMTALEQRNSQIRLTEDLIKRGVGQAQILANASNLFVANTDLRGLSLLARTATANDQAEYAAFFSATGDLLAAAAADDAAPAARTPFTGLSLQPGPAAVAGQRWVDGYLEITEPIIYAYKPIGTIAIRLDSAELVDDRTRTITQGIITALVVLTALSVIVGLLLRQRVILPLRRLSEATGLISAGTWVNPPGQERHDEIGHVARSLNQMIATLQSRETQLQEQVLAVQTLNAELDTRVAERTQELQTLVNTQEQLLDQIRLMSIPVVPVQHGVIAIPLIGNLDSERMTHLIPNLLAGIEDLHARFVALDITGVPIVDTQVAAELIRAAGAARLLGATMALVGIRPEVAQTLVQLGVDFAGLQTHATLQEALLSSAARHAAGRSDGTGTLYKEQQ